jgi:hypothetical protein
MGKMRASSFEYVCKVTLPVKKDGSKGLCGDSRPLNMQTHKKCISHAFDWRYFDTIGVYWLVFRVGLAKQVLAYQDEPRWCEENGVSHKIWIVWMVGYAIWALKCYQYFLLHNVWNLYKLDA